MDIPAESPPSAKKRRTLTEESKQRPLECEQKFQRPLECIREFKLPQQFPSTIEQARKSGIGVKPLSSNVIVSASGPKSDVRVPYNLQKLRILSPKGRDLGEFNVKLKPAEPQGSSMITIAKLKPVKKLLTLAPIPHPMFPQKILPQSIGNIPKKNWTQLSCGRSIISCVDNGSGLHQQQSKTQPMNIILLNDQGMEDNVKKQMLNSNINISTKLMPINAKAPSTNGISSKRSVCQPVDSSNSIKTHSHKELVKSPCLAKSKKLARISSDKNDAPLSDKSFKTNKKKRVYTAINTENGWKMIRPSRSARLGQKYNQIDKNLNHDGLRDNSRENFNSNEVSHKSQQKSNSLQAKSDVVSKSQVPEVNTQNVMTVIPNNKTLSSNQNEVLAQASTKDVTNVPDLDTVGRETQCDDTQSEGLKAESRNDHLVVDDHARDTPEPQQITDAVQSNVQDENSSREDLSDRLSIIKKAMDSVKDNELRELALKALADCGIGIERYVPIRPPEDHKAVHDTQVQTTVFGLLDPNSFILINKDLEDVHRLDQVTLQDMPDNENRLADDPHSNNNFVSNPDVSEQERPFDVDSFMEEFWKEDTDALKMKETLSMTRVRCNSLLENLQRDFERVKEYDQNGMLNIHNAVVSDNVYLVRRQLIVLQHCKQSVDTSTEDGVTSLELAIKYDACSEIVKLLLDAGAQPVISRSIHESAVIIASKQSSPMLPMLVSRVSNSDLLNQIDSDGLAAIHYCSIHGNLEGVRALISAGATVDLKDMKSGRTALFHAIDNSHTSVTQVLLNSGAVANIANYAGQTALSILSDPKSLAFKMSLKKDVT
ncbi:uncharacterized protein LOC112468223 isoform X4 [Temnothorax curvispinosus]|uniref:Uncharacterized protein LOC112468223 isoform X4 n=1 Tax=Temnothorax curvispinosus TaxID=300111 RepID=A0A6J1RK05_9HYME|nr:uncharacterized protein LOC112468223 isoform X4 [Temnothorax curvispinosus]